MENSSSSIIIEIKKGQIVQRDQIILKDIDITINSGELIYLTGKVGSGKSTLLKTLYAELPLDAGEGHVAGFDLNSIKESQIPFLRRKMLC